MTEPCRNLNIWPPHALRITCASTELRVLRESDIPALLALKAEGVTQPGIPQPFVFPWHQRPDEEAISYWYQRMAQNGRRDCTLAFVVRDHGEVAGMQDFSGEATQTLRSMETGSWLGRRFHGRGIGTRMRQMALAFAFDHLGMEEMRSGAHVENWASRRVSEKCGYQADGTERIKSPTGNGYEVNVRYRVTPQTFVRPTATIEYEGVEELKRYLGI